MALLGFAQLMLPRFFAWPCFFTCVALGLRFEAGLETVSSSGLASNETAKEAKPEQMGPDGPAITSGHTPFGWHMVSFNREDVASNMNPLNCDGLSRKGSRIPPDLSGLWWQDGVAGRFSPEVVASYAQGRWEPGAKGCKSSKLFHYRRDEKKRGVIRVGGPYKDEVPCQGKLSFFAFDHRTWAYTFMSEIFAKAMAISPPGTMNMRYEMVCGGREPGRLTICKMGPRLDFFPQRLLAKILGMAVFPLEWSMVRITDDLWVRYSLWPVTRNSPPDKYYVKRIVNCDGYPGRYWSQYSSGVGDDRSAPATDEFGHPLNLKNRKVVKAPRTLTIRAHQPTDRKTMELSQDHVHALHGTSLPSQRWSLFGKKAKQQAPRTSLQFQGQRQEFTYPGQAPDGISSSRQPLRVPGQRDSLQVPGQYHQGILYPTYSCASPRRRWLLSFSLYLAWSASR